MNASIQIRPDSPHPGPTLPAEGAKARATEAARQLFFERGFHATSIADVLARSGLNAGSLYYHFKSKDHLLEAVMRGYLDMLEPFVMGPARDAHGADPIARIFALLDGYRRQLVGSGFLLGCPVGGLAIEISTTHPAARALVVENFAAWQATVRGWIVEAQATKALGASALPDALASFVLVTMEGAMVVAKARQSTEPWDQAIACLRSVFIGLGWKSGGGGGP